MCVNGTFQCHDASHTGHLALNVYSGSQFALVANMFYSFANIIMLTEFSMLIEFSVMWNRTSNVRW